MIWLCGCHDDVIKWKHVPRYWPFVQGIHRSPVNSPHKGQWSGALMYSLICVWIKDSVNNREAGDLRRYRAHHDVTLMVAVHWPNWDSTVMDSTGDRGISNTQVSNVESVFFSWCDYPCDNGTDTKLPRPRRKCVPLKYLITVNF